MFLPTICPKNKDDKATNIHMAIFDHMTISIMPSPFDIMKESHMNPPNGINILKLMMAEIKERENVFWFAKSIGRS